MTRTAPPSGTQPPARARLGDAEVSLEPLAEEICRRYRQEFPDEEKRYGEAGNAWCRHDNQWLLAWAFIDAKHDDGTLARNAAWLAAVLHARDFPTARLARDLELAAAVVAERLGEDAAVAAGRLRAAADGLRARYG